jgi:hypothetical protein
MLKLSPQTRRQGRAQKWNRADKGGPFGFAIKPKDKQSKRKVKCGMERSPLIFGVKTRLVSKKGTDTFARYR